MTVFTEEKESFRSFYDQNRLTFEQAKERMIVLLEALLSDVSEFTITKIEGRVKDREECIGKFTRKYRSELEASEKDYVIADSITDLLGVRIVCLYENEVELIVNRLRSELEVIRITDKTSDIESTEGSFGYKGVHVDLRLNADAINLEASSEDKEDHLVPAPEAAKGRFHVSVPNYHPLDAFSFLRIANHFFPGFNFDDHKVDGFVSRITDLYPGISRGRFNLYMRETISRVKEYRDEMEAEGVSLNAYTVIRHCLYMADPGHFTLMLNDDIRNNFKDWMVNNNLEHVVDSRSD